MQHLEFETPLREIELELRQLRSKSATQDIDMSAEISMMESKLIEARERIHEQLTPWHRVQIARHTSRPYMLDYMSLAFTDFFQLHGDRHIGDDTAKQLGLIDDVIAEPVGGAHHDHQAAADSLREVILRHLAELSSFSSTRLLDERYTKFRNFGEWLGKA